MTSPLRLMCIFAHPDDESMGMGATLAACAAQGFEIALVTATRGQRGWFSAEIPQPDDPQAIGRVREAELRAAADALGIHHLTVLDYMDGDLDQADPGEIIPRLAGLIAAFRPQVLVTFPPDGQYGHPDHIAIGQFATAALVQAAAPRPDSPAGWQVSKLYYMVDTLSFVAAVREQMGPVTFDVDGQPRNHVGWEEWAITTRIDQEPGWRAALAACLCHRSQLGSLGPLPHLPEVAQRDYFGRMGAFVRVYSLVNGGRAVETDLFAGLR
jgi:LmbE family N-acetylglucosaminyl deacetylase